MNGREHTEEDVRVHESTQDYDVREGPRMRAESHEELSGKSPAELEENIDRIRQDMDSTLSQLERKFSPSEILDRTLHYVRGGPGEYVSNLGDQVKNNPLPTALIGIGLGWLMMGGGQPARRLSSHRSGEKSGQVQEKFSEKAGQAREKLSGSARHARERVSGTAERVKGTAGRVKGKMEDITHSVGERMHMAGDKMHSMGEKARDARDRMSETRDRIGEARHSAGERMQQARGKISDKVSDMVHEQPLLLGVLGIAAGAFLGAMIPPTRREDEYLGEMSDNLKHQAVEKGREQMETAKHIASKAGEAAREESQRQLH